jgi:hypothetical protein
MPRRLSTAALWSRQDRPSGHRRRLYEVVSAHIAARRVLYPGCWCDVSASQVWDEVTYVDLDGNAARFFADDLGVRSIVDRPEARWRFLHADYLQALDLPVAFDLLLSMYSGPLGPTCLPYVTPGGWFLANPSHGDVALAMLDPALELNAVIVATPQGPALKTDDVASWTTPKRAVPDVREHVATTGRGVPYQREADAYLFRVRPLES